MQLNSLRARIIVGGCLAAGVALPAFAQGSYPAKPIRMLVGFAPGGFTDIAGRLAAQGLAEALGQQVLVENRAGSNGALAADAIARATPDGYSLYMASPGHTTNPILQTQAQAHPIRDFTAISAFADIPNVLVVHNGLPAKNMKEFIALARTRSTPLTQATTGIGAPGHLIGELLQIMINVKFIHVPYKGSGPIMPDLISGQIDFSFPTAASALPTVQAGRIRALGVASPRRSKAYPDVPTISEAGVPGFEVMGWYGVFGPAKLPREITTRLSNEMVKIARRPDIVGKLNGAGAEPIGSNTEEFSAFVAADYEKWLKVIKTANIKVD